MNTEITVVYSFNDKYAKLASVSMTSLVLNTKRVCNIHIFENSISKETSEKILKLENMYENAKITFHHIPDELFEEVKDDKWGKEIWYPLLAPEILCNFDKALMLEPDTLICRGIEELYDINLSGKYAAVRPYAPMMELYGYDCWKYWGIVTEKSCKFNVGVMLFNLQLLREQDAFNMKRLCEVVRATKPGIPIWSASESFLSYIFTKEQLIGLSPKYNSQSIFGMNDQIFDMRLNYGDAYDAINNPVIMHFTSSKPYDFSNNSAIGWNSYDRLKMWWDYLALSPFAEPEKDRINLDAVLEHYHRQKSTVFNISDYQHYRIVFDFTEAAYKLRELSAIGKKIIIYGAGEIGCKFVRLARLIDVDIDFICDLVKSGQNIDDVPVQHPDVLEHYRINSIVVIAIESPAIWTDVSKKLKSLGFQDNQILPIFEHLAVNGRKWSEIIGSISEEGKGGYS